LKETGKIVDIREGQFIIEVDEGDGCRTCELRHTCRSMGTGKRELKIRRDKYDYKPGDFIEIETSPRSLLTAAFLVFILPLLISIASSLTLYILTGRTGIAFIVFFVSFIVAEILVKAIDRMVGGSSFFEPKIVRKIK